MYYIIIETEVKKDWATWPGSHGKSVVEDMGSELCFGKYQASIISAGLIPFLSVHINLHTCLTFLNCVPL